MFILILIVIVAVVVYAIAKSEKKWNGGTVDSEHEHQFKQKISESHTTKTLQMFLMDRFGDIDGEEVNKLRQLAAGGGRAGYLMEVDRKGILFKLINRKGELMDSWAITFDAMGCEDLPGGAASVLQKILLETLGNIPHLMVLDTGFFMYNQNRPKQSW